MRLLLNGGAVQSVKSLWPDEAKRPTKYLGWLSIPQKHIVLGRDNLPWAADNGCFKGLDKCAWLRMLAKIVDKEGCMWVVAPDSLGKYGETERLWHIWRPALAELGFKVAYVAQDGCKGLPVMADALFIGGSDEFKYSNDVKDLVSYAKLRNLPAHMGRVNTMERLEYATRIDCTSVDGSGMSKYAETYLPKFVGWLKWYFEDQGRILDWI
jgi:hypothetical protein